LSNERFWLNGDFLPDDRASISLLDRGLLMGDALYEVVRFYRYRPFLLEKHLARLFGEAVELDLPVRYGPDQLTEVLRGLIERSPEPDGTVYFQWTRGSGIRSLTPGPDLIPNLFAIRYPLNRPPASLRKRGAPVITLPDERWQKTRLKTTNLLASVLARKKASGDGAFEAILYRGRGGPKARITEGTTSSIFIVSGGELATPRLRELLPGITREAVLEIAAGSGIPVDERTVTLGELREADEAFLTATTLEVLPISTVDGASLRRAVPGKITAALSLAFRRFRTAYLRNIKPFR